MIARNTHSFIVGKDTYPKWFKDLSDSGSVSYNTSNTGELISITVQTKRGLVTANNGDVLMLLNGVATVVPAEAVDMFMGGGKV